VQPTGINPGLIRALTAGMPDVVTQLLTPGKVLQADVVSVFQDRAVLAFGKGVRLEVALQTPLQEGQKVRVQVQPRATSELPQPTQPQPGQPQLLAVKTAPDQPPIVLKVLEQTQPGQPQAAAGQAPRTAEPGTSAPLMQSQPATQAQPQAQPGAPQVFWLPIALPDGTKGWAQLHIQEDDSPRARKFKGGAAQQVRIWWDTPALGSVQVSMEAVADKLTTLFTTVQAESRTQVEEALPDLRRRLAGAGFPEAALGCRTAPPGEPVEPARVEGASLLDRRL